MPNDTATSPQQLPATFSPSAVHEHLIEQTSQQLRYNGPPVADWQEALRRKVTELLGIGPLLARPRTALNVRPTWHRDHELGTIDRFVFTSEEGADVPAYFCLPHGLQAPYPTFICLQGHSTGMHNSIAVDFETETETIDIPGDRDFGLGCMRHGIAALCIEQRSFGMRRERKIPASLDYLCHQAAMNALMLGQTLMGERVYDVDRAIDYLQTRGDIDMDRLGVMGNSGGGTATFYASALLPRVKAAMPSCAFSTFRASIMGMFHCVCNYIPHMYEYAEMADIAGLSAPKPMVIVSGVEDGIFPIHGVRSEFKRLQAIYADAGVAENVQLVEGPEGHRFYADLAWPVMKELL